MLPSSLIESAASSATVYASRTAKMVLGDRQPDQTVHRHKPIELVVALDGPIDMLDGRGNRQQGASFLVPPMCAHSLQAYGGRLARIYLDVGYRRLSLWKGQGICSDLPGDDIVRLKIECFLSSDRSPEAAAELMDFWLQAWLDEDHVGAAVDPRIATVLAYLDSRDGPVEADRKSLAALVGLSPTRFAALFAENTGMPLGRYLIWRRVKVGLALVCAGNSITAAAAHAGFSDGAHFARSCRATYGYPPSHATGMIVAKVKHSAFGGQPLEGRHICLSPPDLPPSLSAVRGHQSGSPSSANKPN